ncbi:hypothetical protein [Streptomyces sp. Mo3]|uniref:hypothetical protein n=1 Tax=Streptomyces sp. Mo3 TaxID=3161190 RepID=UPI0039EEBA83
MLVGLGMVPGQTGLGGEGAGVVVDIGPEVTHVSRWAICVMGVLDHVVRTDWRSPTRGCWRPIPDGWSYPAGGGSVPVAYLTAWYGLDRPRRAPGQGSRC